MSEAWNFHILQLWLYRDWNLVTVTKVENTEFSKVGDDEPFNKELELLPEIEKKSF